MLGPRIAALRRSAGISQSELARRIGTGRQTVNGLIIGKDRKGPTLETAMAIADALGVSLQEMVDRMKEE